MRLSLSPVVLFALALLAGSCGFHLDDAAWVVDRWAMDHTELNGVQGWPEVYSATYLADGRISEHTFSLPYDLVSDLPMGAGPISLSYDESGRLARAVGVFLGPLGESQIEQDHRYSWEVNRIIADLWKTTTRRRSCTNPPRCEPWTEVSITRPGKWSYDALGRLVSASYPPASDRAAFEESFEYDDAGRLVSRTRKGGTLQSPDSVRWSCSFDSLGRRSVDREEWNGGEARQGSYRWEAGRVIYEWWVPGHGRNTMHGIDVFAVRRVLHPLFPVLDLGPHFPNNGYLGPWPEWRGWGGMSSPTLPFL
jgi:YD repeat-containing protein